MGMVTQQNPWVSNFPRRPTNPNVRIGGGPAAPRPQPFPQPAPQFPLTQQPPRMPSQAPITSAPPGGVPGFQPSWKMAGYNSLDEWKAATGGVNPLAQRGFGPAPVPGPQMPGSLFGGMPMNPGLPGGAQIGMPGEIINPNNVYSGFDNQQINNPNVSIGYGPVPISNLSNTMGVASPMMNTVGYFGFRP